MPQPGRPFCPATPDAQRKRDEVKAYLEIKGLTSADLARLSHVSASSITRVLNEQPVRDRPALQKLHKFVSDAPADELSATLSALGRVVGTPGRHEAAAAAQILRAVADLLDRVDRR